MRNGWLLKSRLGTPRNSYRTLIAPTTSAPNTSALIIPPDSARACDRSLSSAGAVRRVHLQSRYRVDAPLVAWGRAVHNAALKLHTACAGFKTLSIGTAIHKRIDWLVQPYEFGIVEEWARITVATSLIR